MVCLRRVKQTLQDVVEGIMDKSQLLNFNGRQKKRKLVAICTTQRSHEIFECRGVAMCDNNREGGDECSGGLPWRGSLYSDPLKEGMRR